MKNTCIHVRNCDIFSYLCFYIFWYSNLSSFIIIDRAFVICSQPNQQSQTQNQAKWVAACGHVSASSQSLRFILSLRIKSSFITSRPDINVLVPQRYDLIHTCLWSEWLTKSHAFGFWSCSSLSWPSNSLKHGCAGVVTLVYLDHAEVATIIIYRRNVQKRIEVLIRQTLYNCAL